MRRVPHREGKKPPARVSSGRGGQKAMTPSWKDDHNTAIETQGVATMSGSWRIGRIARIDIYNYFTFLSLMGLVALTHYLAHGNLGEALGGLVFIVILFGIIVL